MKYKSLIIALIGIINLHGMEKHSNYPDLQFPTAPEYSMQEKLKEYPALYDLSLKNRALNSKLMSLSTPYVDRDTALSIMEEIVQIKKQASKVSFVQQSSGACTQSISHCQIGGKVTQINSRNATVNNVKTQTQNTIEQKNYSFIIPLTGGLLSCAFIWWYLK